jgi:hypothetical protein
MRTACLEITDGYYDTVPTFPSIDLGTRERREWVGNQLAKGLICHGFSFPSVSGTIWPKSLKYMTFRFPVVVIERGGSGPSLSLILTNQRDTENADCANHSQFRPLSCSADPGFSRAPAAVGRRDALACHSPSRRKSSAARCPRAARAALVRTSRTDLSRGRFLASRFGPGAPSPIGRRSLTPVVTGGYSHD